MRNSLLNLVLLAVLAGVLFVIAPDIIRQILGIYTGLGILPVIAGLILLAALPDRTRRRRR